VSVVTLCLGVNLALIVGVSNWAIGYVLFPFANGMMKYNYHMAFNKRMVMEMVKNFKRTNQILQDTLNQPKFQKVETLRDYKLQSKQIEKMCDYVNLFGAVNR